MEQTSWTQIKNSNPSKLMESKMEMEVDQTLLKFQSQMAEYSKSVMKGLIRLAVSQKEALSWAVESLHFDV